MTPCPPRERLEQFLGDQLNDGEGAVLVGHVEDCVSCQQTLESLTDSVLGQVNETLSMEKGGRPQQATDSLPLLPGELSFLDRLANGPLDRTLSSSATPSSIASTVLLGNQGPPDGPAGGPTGAPAVAGYTLLGELGRGGMGVVYKARHSLLKRIVALKMIVAGGQAGPEDRARFRAEAEAVARLQHPHIVQLHEVGEQNGQPYFSLEFLAGGTLAAKLAGTPLPPVQAARLLEPLASAMHAAHQQGILHRDLKPANILLTTEGVPKITDFGLAKLLDAESGQTCTGQVLGTPSHMAPEQAVGQTRKVSPATDIYALGAILYEMLTGRPPFKGTTVFDTLEQVCTQEPVSLARLQPQVPRDLETICLKCLDKAPNRRYTSAAELGQDLGRFLAGQPIQARPVARWERVVKWARRRPEVAALSALSAALFLLGFSLVAWKWQEATANARTAEANAAAEARARGEYQRQSATLALDNGLRLCEQGQVDHGLIWLARSLELAPPKDRDLQRLIRTNLNGWRDRLLVFRGAVTDQLGGGWVHALTFTSDGRKVLMASTEVARLWDSAMGKAVGPVLPRNATGSKNASLFPWLVAMSADGQIMATANPDHTVWLRKSATGQSVGRPLPHPGRIVQLVVSPNGRRVLTGCGDGSLRLWQADTGELKWALPIPPSTGMMVLAVSPDWKKAMAVAQVGNDSLLTALQKSRGATIRIPDQPGKRNALLVDLATGQPIGAPLPIQGAALRPLFTTDSKRVVMAGQDAQGNDEARLVDVATGKPIGSAMTISGGIKGAAFTTDGKFLVTASGRGIIQRWDVATGKAEALSRSLPGTITFAVFGPGGRTVLTGGGVEHTAQLLSAETGKPIGQPLPVNGLLVSAAFRPDGRLVLTGDSSGTVRLWGLPRDRQRATALFSSGGRISTAALSPNGKTVVSANVNATAQTLDNEVRLLDVATGRLLTPPLRHRAYRVEFSPDGHTFLVLVGNAVELRKTATGVVIGQPLAHAAWVSAVAFSPDGRKLLTGTTDGKTRLWEVATARPLAPPLPNPNSTAITAIAFSPDGRRALLGSAPHRPTRLIAFSPDATRTEDYPDVRFLDVAAARFVGRPLPYGGRVHAFSPDGRLILTGSGKTACLWEAGGGKLILPLLVHDNEITCVAFSPDGRTLATGSADGSARLWDTATGRPLGIPLRHTGLVTALVFSPDGKRVFTNSSDGARLWDTRTGRPLGPPLYAAVGNSSQIMNPDWSALLVSPTQDGEEPTLRTIPGLWRGDPGLIMRRVQVLTRLKLDPGGGVGLLEMTAWEKLRRELTPLLPREISGRKGVTPDEEGRQP